VSFLPVAHGEFVASCRQFGVRPLQRLGWERTHLFTFRSHQGEDAGDSKIGANVRLQPGNDRVRLQIRNDPPCRWHAPEQLARQLVTPLGLLLAISVQQALETPATAGPRWRGDGRLNLHDFEQQRGRW
jgi:hypothetical protein